MKLSVIFMLIAKRAKVCDSDVASWPWVGNKDYWCFEENISAAAFIERSREVLNTALESVLNSFMETPSIHNDREVIQVLQVRENAIAVFAQAAWWACKTYAELFPESVSDGVAKLADLPAKRRLKAMGSGQVNGMELWVRAFGEYKDRSLLVTLAIIDKAVLAAGFKTSDQIGVEKFVNQIQELSDQLPYRGGKCYESSLLEYIVTNVRWLIGTNEERLALVNLGLELE